MDEEILQDFIVEAGEIIENLNEQLVQIVFDAAHQLGRFIKRALIRGLRAFRERVQLFGLRGGIEREHDQQRGEHGDGGGPSGDALFEHGILLEN